MAMKVLAAALLVVQASDLLPRPSSAPAGGDCSRHLSREAVEIVESDILAYALKQGVGVSASCPLNPDSSRYVRQELLKKELRHGLWECGACKKRFRAERWLDGHLDRQHLELLLDKQCMADYCGLLGCPGLLTSGTYESESAEAVDETGGEELSLSASPSTQEPGGQAPTDNKGRETSAAAEVAGVGMGAEAGQGNINKGTESAQSASSDVRRMRGQSGTGAVVNGQKAGIDYGTSGGGPGHVHETTHRSSLAARHGPLSSRQKRERARCTAIITSCFPAPPSQPTTQQRDDNAAGNAANTYTTVEKELVNGSVTKASPAKQLLRRPPVQQPREIVLATRHELIARFCDRTVLTKVEHWTERKNQESSRRTTFYIIAIVIICSVLLAWLLQVLDQSPGPGSRRKIADAREAEEAAALIALMQKKYEGLGVADSHSSSKAASSAVRRTTAAADASQNIAQGRRTSAGQRKGR